MLISVAIVTRRTLVLSGVIPEASALASSSPTASSSAASRGASFDAAFSRHATLTMIHIVPGLVFALLAPLQFVRTLRQRRPRLHRILGRVVLTAGLITGATALVMTSQMAIGGATERAATSLFGVLFLIALVKAFLSIRRRDVVHHREWMIRAFAIGIAVATVRPIVGMFFATQRLTHLTPAEFFGIAFWIGFLINLIAAEAWIRHTRRHVELRPETTRAAVRISV
jgi:uncharacterized membrane protein